MAKVQRVESYLTPRDAERLTRLRRSTLLTYLNRGLLTHFRTKGGHRRFALSELRALLGR